MVNSLENIICGKSDEELVIISQSDDQDYQSVAVEIAKAELKRRGVSEDFINNAINSHGGSKDVVAARPVEKKMPLILRLLILFFPPSYLLIIALDPLENKYGVQMRNMFLLGMLINILGFYLVGKYLL